MSKKFHERLLRGSGLQARPFHSKFGAALLKKFGWEEGQGLGKESNGRVECVQVRRREENVGLGHENASETKAQDQWKNWWEGLYNSMAEKLRTTAAERRVSQSTLSSESGDDGEDGCAVKPLYGKKSLLTAGRRTQTSSSANVEGNDVTVEERCRAENAARDTDSYMEKDTCPRSKNNTDKSALQQKKKDPCFSVVDGTLPTAAAVTTRSHQQHASAPPATTDPPVSVSQGLSAAQSFVSEDMVMCVVSKKKRRKNACEIIVNVGSSTENGRTDGAQTTSTSTHESQTGKKAPEKRNGNALFSADLEIGDESEAQSCCAAVKQSRCFVSSDNTESPALKAQPRLKLKNGGIDEDVKSFSDNNLIKEGSGLPTAGGDSCMCDDRRKSHKKSKRRRELQLTGEEDNRNGGEGVAVEGDADEGHEEDVARRKKEKKRRERGVNTVEDETDVKKEKTKVFNEDSVGAFENKRNKKKKKKQKHCSPDV